MSHIWEGAKMHLKQPFTVSRMACPIVDMWASNIAQGQTFIRTDKVTIPANSVIRFLGKLSTHDVLLMRWSFIGSRVGLIAEFYESPTIVTNGSPAFPVNRNRVHSGYQSSIQTFSNPTVSSEGTLLYQTGFPGSGGGPPSNAIIESRDPFGWLLRKETDYMWKLSNTSDQSMEVYVEIDWAEL
jgi:hypothetical protein